MMTDPNYNYDAHAEPTPTALSVASSAKKSSPAWNKVAVISLILLLIPVAGYMARLLPLYYGVFFAVGAVVTGHIALHQTKRTKQQGRTMALISTIIGYLFITATVLVFGLLYLLLSDGTSI